MTHEKKLRDPVEPGKKTYWCKEYKTLYNELRAEYDQEIYRRILDDLIQDRGDPGSS